MNQLIAPGLIESDAVREEPIQILEFWRSVVRRKWSILALTLAVTVVVWSIVSTLKPVYRSTVTVLVETGKAKVVSVDELYSGISANREFFQTQVEIIKSREVARKVIERLNLVRNPEFDPRQQELSLWRKLLAALGIDEGKPLTDEIAEKRSLNSISNKSCG